MADARIDKYLWAIRAFKTRTDATDACKGGKVKIAGVNAKPSKEVKPGDVLTVKKGAVTYTYKVLQPLERRVWAKQIWDAIDFNDIPDDVATKFGLSDEDMDTQ